MFCPVMFFTTFLLLCFCYPCVQAQGPSEIPLSMKYSGCIMNIYFVVTYLTCIPARWVRILDYLIVGLSKLQTSPSFIEESKTTLTYYDNYRKRNHDVDIYTYAPEAPEDEEIIMLYIHGGGYIFFHPLCFSEYYRELITVCSEQYSGKFSLRIIAPNYRKSPEYKVDSILFECVEVLKWIRNEYPKVQRIVLSGDSAGGNMAALLSNYLRDTSYKIIDKTHIHTIPIYPGGLIYQTKENWEEFFVPRLNHTRKKFGSLSLLNRLAWKQVKGLGNDNDLFRGKYNSYDLIRKTENLPSFFIVGATYCPLCCEAGLYSEKLKESGNEDVEFIQIDDIHGFSTNGMGLDPKKSKTLLVQNVLRSINNRFK